jgi:hypothetical protein
MASHEGEDTPRVPAGKPYAPHDVIGETSKTAVVGLASGFFIAAVQNALSRRNVGAFGVFTRGGTIIGISGMHIFPGCISWMSSLIN